MSTIYFYVTCLNLFEIPLAKTITRTCVILMEEKRFSRLDQNEEVDLSCIDDDDGDDNIAISCI